MTHRKYNYWLGIRGIRYINHGEWSDPEIRYKNIVINYYDLEDYVCNAMKEENKCPDNETEFENWCKENRAQFAPGQSFSILVSGIIVIFFFLLLH